MRRAVLEEYGMNIPMDLLALAYELRCEGCSWRNISKGLGIDRQTMVRAIARLTTEQDECLNS